MILGSKMTDDGSLRNVLLAAKNRLSSPFAPPTVARTPQIF
jgi:hypothetical protein